MDVAEDEQSIGITTRNHPLSEQCGLVKLSKGPAEDCFADVDDILEGRVPPEKPKTVKPPAALTKPPSGDKAPGGPPARPGGPPSMPGMPPRPPGPPPTLAPKGQ